MWFVAFCVEKHILVTFLLPFFFFIRSALYLRFFCHADEETLFTAIYPSKCGASTMVSLPLEPQAGSRSGRAGWRLRPLWPASLGLKTYREAKRHNVFFMISITAKYKSYFCFVFTFIIIYRVW